MKKAMFIFFLLIVFNQIGFSQDVKKPVLLSFFEPSNEDLSETIYRVGEIGRNYMKFDDGVIAIRVCSQDPLPVSLINAIGNPFSTVARLENNHSIPKSKILFLRQAKNCKLYKNDYALTEYWFVPQNSEFPEYVEIRKSSDLFGTVIVRNDFEFIKNETPKEITPQLFTQTLDELVKKMKENKTTFAVIHIPLVPKISKSEIVKRALEAQEYLKRSGISDYRIYLRELSSKLIMTSSGKIYYPDIFLVGEN